MHKGEENIFNNLQYDVFLLGALWLQQAASSARPAAAAASAAAEGRARATIWKGEGGNFHARYSPQRRRRHRRGKGQHADPACTNRCVLRVWESHQDQNARFSHSFFISGRRRRRSDVTRPSEGESNRLLAAQKYEGTAAAANDWEQEDEGTHQRESIYGRSLAKPALGRTKSV